MLSSSPVIGSARHIPGVLAAIDPQVDAIYVVVASSRTVMLAALPVIVGVRLLLSALNHDVAYVPATPRVASMPECNRGE